MNPTGDWPDSRLTDLSQRVERLEPIAIALATLTQQMVNLSSEVVALRDALREVQGNPAGERRERFRVVIGAVVGAVVSAILVYVLAHVQIR